MTRPLPPDLPDPEPPGPTIWAAREVRLEPIPTTGAALARVLRAAVCLAVLAGIALIVVGGCR